MSSIDIESTVGTLVREKPSRARVFESMKIDYCCGGKVSLSDACDRRNVDPIEVLERLRQCDTDRSDENVVDADAMSLTQLADHIEETHHAYLREELPRLDFMTEKVSRVHGAKEPRLLQVREAFVALQAELIPHMMKEEQVLFPMIRTLESRERSSDSPCDSIVNPIHQMEHEHDQAGESLAILREATDGFVPPPWACNTYRAMLDSLQQLEGDLHQHIHKENNVLFPRAIEFRE